MNIAIFGMGYVGAVSGACLAQLGHKVIGVDVNPTKVNMINEGVSPIIEKDIDQIIKEQTSSGNYSATTNTAEAIDATDVAFICVGTPSQRNGSLSLKAVEHVSEQIGEVLKGMDRYYVVVVRSTVLPGTVESVVVPILEKASGKKAGEDFGVCMNPEFLREGSSVYDFYNPPKNVIGQIDKRSGDAVFEIYRKIEAPTFRTELTVAEMVKYSDNCFHALKVSFANEVGNIASSLGIDSHKVMEIFCSDTKLNLSPYYLKPGFAFGGSCLPKDLRALTYKAKTLDIEVPVLNSILPSNREQVAKTIREIMQYKGKKIGFLGLSFKGGTDDLRESPIVEVIETVLGKGLSVKIYDKFVSIARLMGANKEYIEKEIPHISTLMVESATEIAENCDVVVIGNKSDEFKDAIASMKEGQVVIDLVRITEDWEDLAADYSGICW
jgi:GDP-mannose 6-dehydrogenase